MGKKLVRAKKLYYLILDDESKYCLLKLDIGSKDYIELDHDLDLFAPVSYTHLTLPTSDLV